MLDVRSLSDEQSDGGVDFSPATAESINHMDIFSNKPIKEEI
ncbi:MAG: hypothetical protein WAU12_12175 [Saprospiraceae bacterium]|jgi:hypothetical protein|nr:hypothetical protein [Candidatus Brachybacter algidus]